MQVAQSKGDHWPALARLWQRTGAPLRVSAEDAVSYAAAAGLDGTQGAAAPRVLFLGVTPEIHGLPWPQGTDIVAVDRSQAMIDFVWPGPHTAARCEDWTALSLPDGSRDLVLGDGGFHLLDHPDGQAALVRSLARVLRPGGRCVLRLFVPPSEPEDSSDVLRELVERGIDNVNVFKLRLGMAMQSSARAGVRVADVWRAFHASRPGDAAVPTRGWSADELLTLEAYRDSPATYHFVTVQEVVDLFCRTPGGFSLETVRTPSYPLGERCPIVVLRRTEA